MSRTVGCRSWLALLVLLIASTCAQAQGWQHVGKVTAVESRKDGAVLKAGSAQVQITFFQPGIVRVRVAPTGSFPKNSSWAVIQEAKAPEVKVKDGKEEVLIAGSQVVVRVKKNPLLV